MGRENERASTNVGVLSICLILYIPRVKYRKKHNRYEGTVQRDWALNHYVHMNSWTSRKVLLTQGRDHFERR